MPIFVDTTTFPQVGGNRTRQEMLVELASYIGGENSTDAQVYSGTVLDEVVRKMNMGRVWTFMRKQVDITLVVDTSVYGSTEGFPADFNEPESLSVVDASGNEVNRVGFIPWVLWQEIFTDQQNATGSIPCAYTTEDVHNLGTLRLEPALGSSLTYPTIRLRYFARILLAPGPTSRLAVPIDFEQAVFDKAKADLVHKRLGTNASILYKQEAAAAIGLAEQKFKAWPDYFGR